MSCDFNINKINDETENINKIEDENIDKIKLDKIKNKMKEISDIKIITHLAPS